MPGGNPATRAQIIIGNTCRQLPPAERVGSKGFSFSFALFFSVLCSSMTLGLSSCLPMNCWRHTAWRSGNWPAEKPPAKLSPAACSRMCGTRSLVDDPYSLRTIPCVFYFQERVDVSPLHLLPLNKCCPSPWVGDLLRESSALLPACPPSWRWPWTR